MCVKYVALHDDSHLRPSIVCPSFYSVPTYVFSSLSEMLAPSLKVTSFLHRQSLSSMCVCMISVLGLNFLIVAAR